MQQYLKRRNGRYYYRRRIPADCRDVFQRTELVVSLNTDRLPQARLHAAELNDEIEGTILRVRRRRRVADFDISNLRGRIMRFETVEETDSAGNRKTTRRIDHKVIQALKDAGVPSDEIANLVRDFNAKASTASAPAPATAPATAPVTVNDLIDRYETHRKHQHRQKPDWAPDAGDERRWQRLRDLTNAGNMSIDTIDRNVADSIISWLSALPKATARGRRLTVQQRVTQHGDQDYARIGDRHLNNHIGQYASLFAYAIREGLYQQGNPFEGKRVNMPPGYHVSQLRDMFEREELAKIFSLPLFTDFDSEAKRIGVSKLLPYRYWTPLIALYTGARPCEIGGLNVADVRKIKDILVFDFNADDPKKCSKTHNAIRCTPVHQHLIDLGLQRYLDEVKARGETRLFPELKWEKKDGYARYIGSNFNESVLKPLNLHLPSKKVFYSFRHTFTTELSRVGVTSERREQLCGREDGESRGAEAHYLKRDSLPTLRAEINRVDFRKELTQVKAWRTTEDNN